MEKMDELLDILEDMNSQVPDDKFYSQHLQYSEDLWNSLDSIANHNKKWTKNTKLLTDFLKGIVKNAESFIGGVHKLADNFEKEMKSEENAGDTTQICLVGLSGRIRTINEIFASHVRLSHSQ